MNYTAAIDSAMQPDKGDESWDTLSDSLHESLGRLEEIIDDIGEMQEVCKDEWCEATECMLDEASIAAFAISEPHFTSDEDSRKLKEMKKRIHDLYKKNKPLH